jgi:RNA polymerase sigma factor (sigma-70 family)
MSVTIDPKLCFVLMPFRPQFEEIYEEIVKPEAEELGLNCVYAEEIFGARRIMDDIWDCLERARVVIAELTDRNPNVFYEVGYAHSLDKGKVILITQTMEDVPFDLQAFRCIEYSLGPRGLRELRGRLRKQMEAVLAEKPQSPRVLTMEVEVPEPADALSAEFLRRQMAQLLSERERKVLELRFGVKDGRTRTLGEVGEILGVTDNRVSQIQAKALRKMVRGLLGW